MGMAMKGYESVAGGKLGELAKKIFPGKVGETKKNLNVSAEKSLESLAGETYALGKEGLWGTVKEVIEKAGLTPEDVGLKAMQKMGRAGIVEWGLNVHDKSAEDVFQRIAFPAEGMGWDATTDTANVPQSVVQKMVAVLEERIEGAA